MATVDQLRELARERGSEGTSGMNKSELLVALGFAAEAEADAYLEARAEEDQDAGDQGASEVVTSRGLGKSRAATITYSTNHNGTIVASVKAAG